MEAQEQAKKQYDWLKPSQFKKGTSGNPGGRKKGAKSMKTFVKEYFEKLDDAQKVDFLKHINPETAWKMAEGNPFNATDISSLGKSINIGFDTEFKK